MLKVGENCACTAQKHLSYGANSVVLPGKWGLQVRIALLTAFASTGHRHGA